MDPCLTRRESTSQASIASRLCIEGPPLSLASGDAGRQPGDRDGMAARHAGGPAQTGGCELTASDYTSAMILEKFPEVQRLSASEKLIFVSELWNDLEAHPSEVPVSREIIAELDRRMEHFRQHPDDFTTWEAVKGRILGSHP